MHTLDTYSLKREVSRFALSKISSGMRLGIGTGSTVDYFVEFLGQNVSSGLDIVAVATSVRSLEACQKAGITMMSLNDLPELDLVIDGADEISPDLSLIKGGGGAFLNEKIVAAASKRMIIIADESKLVNTLGRFPLPLEVAPFGLSATLENLKVLAHKFNLFGSLTIRKHNDHPFLTDGGHYVVDASWSCIPDPRSLSTALNDIPGILGHGLFMDCVDLALVAGKQGIREIYPLQQ